MARIELPEKGWVPSPVWEVYTGAENRLGFIPNTLKAASHSLRSLRVIDQVMLATEEQGTLEPELRIFALLAAAHRNQNAYGVNRVLNQASRYFLADDKLNALLHNGVAEPLFEPREIAVIRFAEAMSAQPDAGEEALEAVREHLSEEKVVELSFLVAGRNFLDRLECTFDVDPEPELAAKTN